MYITENEARIHNLVLRLYNKCEISELKEGLDENKLSNEIFFRESDYQIAIEGGISSYITYKELEG